MRTAGQVCWKHWRLSWRCVHRKWNKIWSKTVTVHLGSGTVERWISFRCHLAVICCYMSAFCCIYKKEGSSHVSYILTLVKLQACSLKQLRNVDTYCKIASRNTFWSREVLARKIGKLVKSTKVYWKGLEVCVCGNVAIY